MSEELVEEPSVDATVQLAKEVEDLKAQLQLYQQELQTQNEKLQGLLEPTAKKYLEKLEVIESPVDMPTKIQVERQYVVQSFLKKYWWDMFKVFIFLCACSGLVVYTITAILDYKEKLASPSTAITLQSKDIQTFPMVTICNWNIGYNCDACHISLLSCYIYVNATSFYSCQNYPEIMKYVEVNLDPPYNTSYFRCYQFNYNRTTALSSRTTGFTGSVSMLFKVPEVPQDNLFRKGVQVSFTLPEAPVPYADETRYATSGSDTFFTITKVENTLIDQPTEHTWNAVAGSLDLPFNDSAAQNYVGVSFGYNTLSITKYDQVATAQPSDLAGNLAGMTGTLTGLDAQKFILMVLSIPYSLAIKSLEPFLDLMG